MSEQVERESLFRYTRTTSLKHGGEKYESYHELSQECWTSQRRHAGEISKKLRIEHIMIDDEDESMKILGISGSNRKDGNSYLLLKEALQEVSPIERKIIQVAELQIGPCKLCFESCSLKPYECAIEDDFGIVLEEMKSADEIVIACPFYFYIPSRFQAFLERLSCVDYFTEERHGKGLSPLAKKPCALIVVSASGSGFNAFQILHHLQEFALTLGMLPVTTNKWPYIGLSAKSDDMERGAILKQTETISESKQFVRLLINEIEKRASK